MNKKGREDTLIPWLLTLVFFTFLMAGFLVFIGFLGGEKILLGQGSEINVVGSEKEILVDDLEVVLNKEIRFNGRDMSIFDAVLLNLDNYFEVESRYDEIGRLVDFYEGRLDKIEIIASEDQGFDKKKIVALKSNDKILGDLISEKIGETCSRFYFQTPFGLVTEKGLEDRLVDMGGGIDFGFYHEGKYFEIKYKKRYCDGQAFE